MTGLVIQVSGWLAEVAILEPSEVSMSNVLVLSHQCQSASEDGEEIRPGADIGNG